LRHPRRAEAARPAADRGLADAGIRRLMASAPPDLTALAEAAAPPPPAPPAPAIKALSCPSCGGTINVKAAGYTVTVACIYCGSILDVANPQVRLITEYRQAMAELEIPLGTRGTL